VGIFNHAADACTAKNGGFGGENDPQQVGILHAFI
jgi:hypothetical protein